MFESVLLFSVLWYFRFSWQFSNRFDFWKFVQSMFTFLLSILLLLLFLFRFFFMCFSVSATLTAMFNVGQAMKSMPEHLKACHATKAYDAHFVRTISLFTHNYFSFFTVTHSEIFTQYWHWRLMLLRAKCVCDQSFGGISRQI